MNCKLDRATKNWVRTGDNEGGCFCVNIPTGAIESIEPVPYTKKSDSDYRFRVRNYEFKVAAPEDLIQNRLYSAKFQKSNTQRDMEQRIALLGIFSDSIDDTYRDKLAKEHDIADYLNKARRYASESS